MIISKAFDVEVLPNLFSIAFVNLNDYLEKFADCVDAKGKPIPIVEKHTVKEIIDILESIDKKVFVITDEDDADLLPLVGYINGMTAKYGEDSVPVRYDLFAFNNKSYDDLMISAFLMYFNRFDNTKELCMKLYETSKLIIRMQDESKDEFFKDPTLVMLKDNKLPYCSVDVMRIFALHKAGVSVNKDTGERVPYGKSLKQTSINLMWYQLLEWHMPPISNLDRHYYMHNPRYKNMSNDELNQIIGSFDRYIIKDWIPDLVHYNFNDVYIVCEMVRMKIDEVRLRYSITNSYKVDVMSEPRSKIADKLVTKFYSEISGLAPSKFIKLKTERTKLSFRKIIFPHIHFKTTQLQSFLEEIKGVTITRTNKDAFSREINFYGTTYSIATGGIHSVDPPRILKSTDEFTYVHWDYASYYPSIMISYEVYPEHLTKNVFVKLVRYLRDTRVACKHAKGDEQIVPGVPNKIAAEALKIVINSIYGKLGIINAQLKQL